MSDDIGAALLGLGLGTFGFFRGFRHLRNKRLVENIPTSRCRSVAMGLCEIAGRAAGAATIPSFIGQIPSYVTKIEIERYQKSGKSSRWVTVHKEQLGIPFYVEDDTGRVKVDPAGAELDIRADIEKFKSQGDGILAALNKAFEIDLGKLLGKQDRPAHQVRVPVANLEASFRSFCNSRGVGFRGPIRFSEWNLSPGDPVYVLGTADEYRSAEEPELRVIIRRGRHHPWYFIAESSEKEVLSRLGTKSALYVWGGAALAVASLGWLVYRLGWMM